MRRGLTAAVSTIFLMAAQGVAAQETTAEATRDCVDTRIAQQSRPGACISQVLETCDRASAETPAVAILCYQDAREVWGKGLSARMAAIQGSASDQLAAIAGIEVKYDLLSNLMQCDRMEELALVGDGDGQAIQRDKARCAAAATGLVYVRLLMRARDL